MIYVRTVCFFNLSDVASLYADITGGNKKHTLTVAEEVRMPYHVVEKVEVPYPVNFRKASTTVKQMIPL